MKKAILAGVALATSALGLSAPSAAEARTYSSFSLYVGGGPGYYDPDYDGYYSRPYYGAYDYYAPSYYAPRYYYYAPRYRWRDHDRWEHRRWRDRDWDHDGDGWRHHRWHD
jgi:hypothetical protein